MDERYAYVVKWIGNEDSGSFIFDDWDDAYARFCNMDQELDDAEIQLIRVNVGQGPAYKPLTKPRSKNTKPKGDTNTKAKPKATATKAPTKRRC